MKHTIYFCALCCLLLFQCKEKKDTILPSQELVPVSLSIPGVSPENIVIAKGVIRINLPENYAGGDFIKPNFKIAEPFTTNSDLLNGFSYNGKDLAISLESRKYGRYDYIICVTPYKPVTILEQPKNHVVTLNPYTAVTVPVSLKGTTQTLNDSGKIVTALTVLLENKETGKSQHLAAKSYFQDKLTFEIPATTNPGEYIAYITWGDKKELLSSQFLVKAGPMQFELGIWYTPRENQEFSVTGYNIPKESKFEMVLKNDFTASRTIPLNYKNAGTLTGNLPKDMAAGNYQATYTQDGRPLTSSEYIAGFNNYVINDNLYIRSKTDQAMLQMITQKSLGKDVKINNGAYDLFYYSSTTNISRNEPLLTFVNVSGPSTDENYLILKNRNTGISYTLKHINQNVYLYDAAFLYRSYRITPDIPNGAYEAFVKVGSDSNTSEKYGRILNIQ